ncbi:MAG: hypothetical protein JXR52_05150 [Bacteroidales bacterium]|nr:hypothetical protein [Bacteroidales bacterium]MBN2698192.1 hypothetical protein [Bacteroidales bacterium]
MGFAEGYLQRHGYGTCRILSPPDPGLNSIVTIPCHNESGLLKSLDSLFKCDTSGIRAEIIIFINASGQDPEAVHRQNRETFMQTGSWVKNHPHDALTVHILSDDKLPLKDAGVGLARKIVMDEAVRRFDRLNKTDGVILSLDADTLVEPDYLVNTLLHFRSDPSIEGCSIYFEHPLEGDEFSDALYNAIALYELHLRYYLRAISCTGYPYAFHTVGSCIGVKAEAYCRYGGMSKRKGGEDFYFIQKVAQNGHFSNCTSTRIIPSPRPSERVPFGTGPAIKAILSGPEPGFLTHNPESFEIIAGFFDMIRESAAERSLLPSFETLHPGLREYLSKINFSDALAEIVSNTASAPAFMKRFWRFFNMLRILKYLHHMRNFGQADIPVIDASRQLLEKRGLMDKNPAGLPDILSIYRKIDRGIISVCPQQ